MNVISHDDEVGSPLAEQLPEDSPPYDPLLDLPELLPRLSREDFGLTQGDVDELKTILEQEVQRQLTDEEAWKSARNLLRLSALFLDITIDQEREKAGLPPRPEPVVTPMPPPEPSPPPVPQPFPIRLELNHKTEIESNLRMLADELRKVKQRPTSWRWATVALYNVLGHSLILRWPVQPKDQLHHMTELFDLAASNMPNLLSVRGQVETLDVLRTTWLPEAMHRWPVTPKDLPKVFRECLSVAERVGAGIRAIDGPVLEAILGILS